MTERRGGLGRGLAALIPTGPGDGAGPEARPEGQVVFRPGIGRRRGRAGRGTEICGSRSAPSSVPGPVEEEGRAGDSLP